MKKGQTCCFTGHRDIPENEYGIITANLERTIRELERNNIIYFGAGGALGFDTLAAQSVIKLRAELPRIKLILVLPCLSQAQRWPELDQRVYETIKAQADKVVYTSQEYTRDCMFKRNRHLVEYSGTCVCYLINQSGGTAYTVRYAKNKGLRIINLAEGGKAMFESRTIYSKRYPREENYEELNKLENEERLLETDAKLEKFKRYIQSIRYQEIPEKMAGRQEFISLAVDLSETFSVDMDIKEKAYGIEVSLHMFCSAYPDIMTQMLAKLFDMSDTSASFILPNEPGDFTLVLDYRTHDSYVDEQS